MDDGTNFQLEKPTTDFTMVCNALLRDKALSLRAKGLYGLMFSKPNGMDLSRSRASCGIDGRPCHVARSNEGISCPWMGPEVSHAKAACSSAPSIG